MSLGTRDAEALTLVRGRAFDGAAVATLALDLQARRLTLRCYGTLRTGDRATYLGTLTFFGTSDIVLENGAGAFPEAAHVSRVALAYDDEADRGTVELIGTAAWSLAWTFDGLAYEEHPAVLASLADERA